MKSTLRTQAALTSAVLFGAAALLAVVFFEFQTDSVSIFGVVTLIPYVSFVLVTMLFGFPLSAWYLPETGYFEAFAVPIILPFASTVVAGLTFAAALTILAEPESGMLATPVLDALGVGIYASFVFLYASWPVLLPAMAVASIVLRTHFSHAIEQRGV